MAFAVLASIALGLPSAAHASFLPPALMDAAATYIAWFVIIVMPIAGIVLFWLVHILPEKIAHKRHHPQKDAIQTLCLLSLVFGGLLWPIAWLWAYTKPVSYRLAYGTDKGDEYFVHMADEAQAGKLSADDMKVLRDELDSIAAKGALPLELHHARAKIEAALVASKPAAPSAAAAQPAAQGVA
jgi:CBS domain containing-hemolysin-like protein